MVKRPMLEVTLRYRKRNSLVRNWTKVKNITADVAKKIERMRSILRVSTRGAGQRRGHQRELQTNAALDGRHLTPWRSGLVGHNF